MEISKCPAGGCTPLQLVSQGQAHDRQAMIEFANRIAGTAEKFEHIVDKHAEIIARFDERLTTGQKRFEDHEGRLRDLEATKQSRMRLALFSGSGGMVLWAIGEKLIAVFRGPGG